MPNPDSISIIIPTRNRPKFLKAAVASALNQSILAKEIIIVDDHSDAEHSQELIELADSNSSIQLHNFKEQKGVSHCRNFGIEKATGTYLLFLDDDDTLNSNMLEDSLYAIQDCDIVSCRTHVFYENTVAKEKKKKAYNWQKKSDFNIYKIEQNPAEHIFLYHPAIHSFLCRKSVFKHTKFLEELAYGEDFYVWLSLANEKYRFKKAPFVGGNYRLHNSNASIHAKQQEKIFFYKKILSELQLSTEVRNVTFIKLSILLFKLGNPNAINYLLKASMKPMLLIRHIRHYWKVYL